MPLFLLLPLAACGTDQPLPPTTNTTTINQTDSANTDTTTPSLEQQKKARALSTILLGIGAITLIFLIGSYVLVRITRRARNNSQRTAAASTDTTDLWMLHQIATDDDDRIRDHHAQLDEQNDHDPDFDSGGGEASCGGDGGGD